MAISGWAGALHGEALEARGYQPLTECETYSPLGSNTNPP